MSCGSSPRDVCHALGFSNGRKAIRDHVRADQAHTERIVTPGDVVPHRDMTVISEAGLYSLPNG
ncbi:BRO family protein [Pseudonocardia acaciae]|uniref:BRO family protein n=1 Tax=Pseudonocardia acaciae TaxID=551276 RepID=UPI0009FF11C2